MNTTSTPQTNATSLASKKNNGDDFDAAKLIENWQQVSEQMAQASVQGQRQKEDITLLAVSNTKPAQMIATLARQGRQDFGENYLQEAIEKIQDLRQQQQCEHLVRHYIGSIQRNKTRDIAENF